MTNAGRDGIPESKFEDADLKAYAEDMGLSVLRVEVKYLAVELMQARERIASLTCENRELREALEWALPFALKAPDPTRSEDDVPSGEWLNKKKQARAALAKKEAAS